MWSISGIVHEAHSWSEISFLAFVFDIRGYRDRNAFYGSQVDERCFSKLIVSFYKSIDQSSSPTASSPAPPAL
jgi:hypothetical protein